MRRIAIASTVVIAVWYWYLFSGYANGFALWRLALGIFIGAIFGWSWTYYILREQRRRRIMREWDEWVQTTFPPRHDDPSTGPEA